MNRFLKTLAVSVSLVAVVGCYSDSEPTGPEVSASGDALVIKHLEQAGSDISKPHYMDFFFFCPDETNARALARDLSERGMEEVTVIPPEEGDSTWACSAMQWHVPELSAIETLTAELNDLASKHESEYDGWGATIVTPEDSE